MKIKTEYIEKIVKNSPLVLWATWADEPIYGSRFTIMVKVPGVVGPKPIYFIHRNGVDSWEIDEDRPVHRDAIDLLFGE